MNLRSLWRDLHSPKLTPPGVSFVRLVPSVALPCHPNRWSPHPLRLVTRPPPPGTSRYARCSARRPGHRGHRRRPPREDPGVCPKGVGVRTPLRTPLRSQCSQSGVLGRVSDDMKSAVYWTDGKDPGTPSDHEFHIVPLLPELSTFTYFHLHHPYAKL